MLKMRRKKAGETVEKLRLDRLAMFEIFPPKCARWAEDHAEALLACNPDMPEGLHDRAEDHWRPLLAIAEQAGWHQPALGASKALEQPDQDTERESAGVLLLTDMRRLFSTEQVDRLLSKHVAEALAKMEERPWPEWKSGKPITVRQIARLLARYEIRPKNIEIQPGSV